MRIHHVALRVDDLEAARRFYGVVLGLPEMTRGDARGLWFRAGDAVLMLERTLRGRGADQGSSHVLAFAADNLDDWHARLTAAGVLIDDRTEHTLFVRDADGHRVALSDYRFV